MPVQTVTRFGILGPLEVLADGRPVTLGGPQQRGLVAVLLLDANRVVSQERLVSDLWGEDPPAEVVGVASGVETAGSWLVWRGRGGGHAVLVR